MPEQQESPPTTSDALSSDDARLANKERSASGFQFRLRTLLLATTALAVVLGISKALHVDINAVLVQVTYMAITGWLLVGLLYAQEDKRAFCLGALIPLSMKWVGGGDNRFWFVMVDALTDATDSIGIPRIFIIEWIYLSFITTVAIANGLLCVYARRYFDRTSPPQV